MEDFNLDFVNKEHLDNSRVCKAESVFLAQRTPINYAEKAQRRPTSSLCVSPRIFSQRALRLNSVIACKISLLRHGFYYGPSTIDQHFNI
jgi:hypothetical protein